MKTGFHDVCSFNNKDKKLLLPVQHLGVLFTMHVRGDLRGTTEKVQQSQTFFDSTKPKNSARDNNRYLSIVFFFTFCINLGFLLHHQHSCCCCPSSFCSVGHMSTLGFNKPLASAENCPHKTYCKYKIRYLKKMLFHIILNETEHNKLPTRSLW